MKTTLRLFASAAALAASANAQQLAFPGADGMGRFAQGGRGGAVEADENVRFTIRDAAGATIGTASAVTTIINDDAPLASGAPIETLRADSVRDAPAGAVIGRQALAATGVIAGPAEKLNGATWWPVDFDAAPDGWVRQVSLRVR